MIRTFLVLTASVVALTGCFGSGQKTTTVKSLDPATLIETTTTTEEDKDFFESGNLRMYYEADGKRVDSHQALALKKIEYVKEQGAARQADLVTTTERVLSNIVDTLLVAQIPTSAPQSNTPAPKTMADVASSGAGVQWAYLGMGLVGEAFDLDLDFGTFGGGGNDGSASLKEVTVAGNLLINSEINDQHYLEEGSAWSESYSPTLSWETYTGNSQNTGQEGQATSSTSTDEEVGILQ